MTEMFLFDVGGENTKRGSNGEMCDNTPYTLYHNDCSFGPQEYVVLVIYHNSNSSSLVI